MNKFGSSTEEDFQAVAYVIKEMITLSYEGFSARASIAHGVTSGNAAVYSDYQGYIPFNLSGSLSAKRRREEEVLIPNSKRLKVLPYTNTNCGSSKYPEGHSHDRDDDDDDDDDGASSAVSEGSRLTDVEEDDETDTEDDSEEYSEEDSSGCSVVESE